MFVITIRGLWESGSLEIGKLVAEKLHVECLDSEIVTEIAGRLGWKDQEVGNKEKPLSSFFNRIMDAMEGTYGYELEGTSQYDKEMAKNGYRYLNTLERVIKEQVRNRSVVIHGHGSEFILKEYPQAFHVLMITPLEVQIERVMKEANLSRENAKKEIARHDSYNREFIKKYFKADVCDLRNYDLIINTKRISLESAAMLIIKGYLSGKDQVISENSI
jgi:cytidylate kinase